MPTVNSIHQLKREGASVSEISKKLGISRNTVYAYLRKTDFSPELPVKRRKPSKLDPYKPVIDSWLEDDRRNWRKQRHSATRIWRRLVDELGRAEFPRLSRRKSQRRASSWPARHPGSLTAGRRPPSPRGNPRSESPSQKNKLSKTTLELESKVWAIFSFSKRLGHDQYLPLRPYPVEALEDPVFQRGRCFRVRAPKVIIENKR